MSERMRVCGELRSMTEYIAEFTVEKKPFGFPNFVIHLHGEIVRCRDCEYQSDDGLTTLWCSENCREVRRDGFCAWGERRDA